MKHSIVPVVLLAIAALSSSNVILMLSTLQSNGIEGQKDENVISDTFSREHILNNIFQDLPIKSSPIERLRRRTETDLSTNNSPEDFGFDDTIDTEDNYNGEGFRKEQWHNYPRQLDRLHDFIFKHYDTYKLSPDTNDPDNTNFNDIPDTQDIDNRNTATNEILPQYRDTKNKFNSIVETTNPLLLLQLHLTSLHSKFSNTRPKNFYVESEKSPSYEEQRNVDEDSVLSDELNPAAKVKREGIPKEDTYYPGNGTQKDRKTVAKRLFSLWSRLQSLSHKGHELPHRRHIHSFYSLPDSAGSGGLSAEIRRDIRPPGAPLRWG